MVDEINNAAGLAGSKYEAPAEEGTQTKALLAVAWP